MVIEKLHGLQATSITLNERFTMLASAALDYTFKPKRRFSVGSYLNQNLNFRNRNLIEQVARRLEQQAKRRALRQRLGIPPGALRRFGSESSLPGLRRSNSFGNLSHQSIKSRLSQRQFNGNLSRSASFSNISSGTWRGRGVRGSRGVRGTRGMRRRGSAVLRGRFRGGSVGGGGSPNHVARMPFRRTNRGRTTRGRGRERGGVIRSPNKPVPTKEELDQQLDQYMASSKFTLDQELDTYMKNAIEID